MAKVRFPRMGANITSVFSLPFFGKNYSEGRIMDDALNTKLKQAVSEFSKAF